LLLALLLWCPTLLGLAAALKRTRWSLPKSCWDPLALLLVARLLLELPRAARWAVPAVMHGAALYGSPVLVPPMPKRRGRRMQQAT
jgi:hypothetical protein